jgi:hypothetical protein
VPGGVRKRRGGGGEATCFVKHFHNGSCICEEVGTVCLTIENDEIGAYGSLSADLLDYILHGAVYVIF